jgi:hypothetical protein
MQVKYPGAYKWARTNDPVLIQTFLGGVKRTNIKDTVYIWELDDSGIYKIGLTSSMSLKDRVEKVRKAGGFEKVNIVIMSVVGVEQASHIERLLKLTGEMVSFGKMFDGYTEFRKWTPTQLDCAISMIEVFTKEPIHKYTKDKK